MMSEADAVLSDAEDAEEDPVILKVISRPSVMASIIAYWMVLDVGKNSIMRDRDGIATGFRIAAYNPIGDCACSFAALSTLYAVAQVILFPHLLAPPSYSPILPLLL